MPADVDEAHSRLVIFLVHHTIIPGYVNAPVILQSAVKLMVVESAVVRIEQKNLEALLVRGYDLGRQFRHRLFEIAGGKYQNGRLNL